MSYSGDANNAMYKGGSVLSISATGSSFAIGCWLKPTSFAAELGTFALSNDTADGRLLDFVALQVDKTSKRLKLRLKSFSVNGPSTQLVVNKWYRIGLFVPAQGFDTAQKTIKFYLSEENGVNAETSTVSITPATDYTGDTFRSVTAGDGVFSETHHKGAYYGVWTGLTQAQADTVMTSMLSNAPSNITPNPAFDAPFVSSVPAGFTASGAISIDAADNPSLSGGGGGSSAANINNTAVIVQ